MDADVTLPKVEEVHVVDVRLPPFDLHDDSAGTDRHIVVGSQTAVGVVLEQSLRLVPETHRERLVQEDVLDHGTALAGLIRLVDRRKDFGPLEVGVELLGHPTYGRPLLARRQLLLHEVLDLDHTWLLRLPAGR